MADNALEQQAIGSTLTLSVVSHGHTEMLARLLDDLTALPSLGGAAVVVTLNLVDEPFDPERWPTLDLHVIRNPQPRGFGANHNASFVRCHTPWFAVLNPDLRMPHDPFPQLVSAASADPRCGVAAPAIVNAAGQREDSVRANLTLGTLAMRALRRAAGQTRLRGIEPAAEASGFIWVAGMFLLFSAPAYRKIGGFDERFFLYCEDYDICARLRRAGHDIVLAPEASAVHDAQRDSQRSMRHLRWHLASLLRVWTSTAFWWVVLHGSRSRARQR